MSCFNKVDSSPIHITVFVFPVVEEQGEQGEGMGAQVGPQTRTNYHFTQAVPKWLQHQVLHLRKWNM